MAANVPGFSGSAQIQPDGTDVTAANNLTSGAQIQNQKTMSLGQLNNQFGMETAPQLDAGQAGAGEWYSSARKVAQGNALRHFHESGDDIIASASNAMSNLYMGQAFTALGMVMP